ncbi:hypothetical protein KGM_203805 [Danaus plexippus plexippus]|uniref:Uncharacterized protein n=1 Tax=Danaus plexippus plexippus TaxID=278856 RepID=A0A212ET82_DANPL|nr:hypothetical protein KGM_203805 [Danaus plexippus plexippus]
MDNDFKDDIIDLTGSMTCALQCTLSNVVIDLVTTDESFYDSSVDADVSQSPVKLKSCKRKGNSQCADIPPKKKSDGYKNKSNSFGECPICWEALGKNPLASTKCGHVYCMKCIERSLQSEKKCPTCRSSLKGKAAYHPLYLSKN